MKIGDKVIVTDGFFFNSRRYNVGDIFTIVGNSGYRGWNIEDENGNIIYETVMLSINYKELTIKELRNMKLDNINKNI